MERPEQFSASYLTKMNDILTEAEEALEDSINHFYEIPDENIEYQDAINIFTPIII